MIFSWSVKQQSVTFVKLESFIGKLVFFFFNFHTSNERRKLVERSFSSISNVQMFILRFKKWKSKKYRRVFWIYFWKCVFFPLLNEFLHFIYRIKFFRNFYFLFSSMILHLRCMVTRNAHLINETRDRAWDIVCVCVNFFVVYDSRCCASIFCPSNEFYFILRYRIFLIANTKYSRICFNSCVAVSFPSVFTTLKEFCH